MRLVAICLTLAVLTCHAQSPAFEVATIKLNTSGSGGSGFPGIQKGVLRATNISASVMLQAAYDLTASRIVGPSWLDADRFDIAGKVPEGVPDTEFLPMMQALLKERFHLEVHHETKELPVYDLVVAKEGLKMAPYDPAKPFPRPQNRGGSMIVGTGTMPQLSRMLAGAAGRPVVDRTGLEGRYTYMLSFMPLSVTAPEGLTDPPPDIFTALTQQLGLKLEPKKEPIDVLVVDHMDRMPTEN